MLLLEPVDELPNAGQLFRRCVDVAPVNPSHVCHRLLLFKTRSTFPQSQPDCFLPTPWNLPFGDSPATTLEKLSTHSAGAVLTAT